LKIRKAKISDLKQAQKLVNDYAKREQMIPRSLNELYETVRDFIVCELNGHVCGVCALHIMWEDLAEIRSLAVENRHQNKGIGRSLVKQCLRDAKALGIKKVFALTYQPEFFRKLGFADTDKASLPQKIWGDCVRCPRFPECDENAVIIHL
jgi:amino-acid N-acetyltransferase